MTRDQANKDTKEVLRRREEETRQKLLDYVNRETSEIMSAVTVQMPIRIRHGEYYLHINRDDKPHADTWAFIQKHYADFKPKMEATERGWCIILNWSDE